jgi:uncharacterized protein YhhL (DUF1145 family)
MVLIVKVLIIATWLAASAGFLLPPDSTFGEIGRTLFYVLFVIHAVECAVFFGALKRTGRPLVLELANTLFFGVIHYAEVRQILEERDAG